LKNCAAVKAGLVGPPEDLAVHGDQKLRRQEPPCGERRRSESKLVGDSRSNPETHSPW
jgi:hypothetical protein